MDWWKWGERPLFAFRSSLFALRFSLFALRLSSGDTSTSHRNRHRDPRSGRPSDLRFVFQVSRCRRAISRIQLAQETLMIDPKEMLATLIDHFATTAKVQNVFGEPIESHGKTIIPVARLSYRLGAGGGIVQATPVGVLEITEAGARFVRFFDPQMATGLIASGIMFGLLLRRLFR